MATAASRVRIIGGNSCVSQSAGGVLPWQTRFERQEIRLGEERPESLDVMRKMEN